MVENSSFRPGGDAIDAGLRRGGRESLIDQECFFEGTFRTPGNMRIEGTYQGAIECQGSLLIAESGQVNARIVAGNLIVAGQLTGEVQCDSRFELLASGRVSGSIGARSTVVHDGARFDGEIRMGDRSGSLRGQAAAQATPAPTIVAEAPPARPTTGASASGNRRRAAQEASGGEEGEEGEVAEAPDEPATPRTNGRSQAASGRDVLPNRTGDA